MTKLHFRLRHRSSLPLGAVVALVARRSAKQKWGDEGVGDRDAGCTFRPEREHRRDELMPVPDPRRWIPAVVLEPQIGWMPSPMISSPSFEAWRVAMRSRRSSSGCRASQAMVVNGIMVEITACVPPRWVMSAESGSRLANVSEGVDQLGGRQIRKIGGDCDKCSTPCGSDTGSVPEPVFAHLA